MAFSESIKLEVRRKSHHTCCLCKSVGVEIHHILPEEESGPDTSDNAAPLCPSCHETYGANPHKRKMIKEARDLWYEICSARYKSDGDRIEELLREISFLKNNLSLPDIATNVASAVIERLTREGLLRRGPEDGWPISKLLEKISRFEAEFPVANPESVEVTYDLMFKTTGDATDENAKELNEVRDEFLRVFGNFIARKICVYVVSMNRVDWKKRITEDEIDRLGGYFFFLMAILLWHEDLNGANKISVSFTETNEFRAWMKESNRPLHDDSQQAARTRAKR